MTRRQALSPFLVSVVLAAAAPVGAQTTPAAAQDEPQVWTVTAGAGLALTSGNTDTSTVNASYELTYAPTERRLLRSDGLFIRGKTEDRLSADRLSLNGRAEFGLNARAFVFGEQRFLRDRFKSIDYLLAPGVGIGYTLVDTPETTFAIDAGLGGVWEKNTDVGVRSSGSLTVGQKLVQAVSETTSLTEAYSGLWKTKDLRDSLHVLSLGLAANVSTRTQLKVELLSTFKNRPARATVEKNDVAVLIAIVYKI